jgi:hypothetical protein
MGDERLAEENGELKAGDVISLAPHFSEVLHKGGRVLITVSNGFSPKAVETADSNFGANEHLTKVRC